MPLNDVMKVINADAVRTPCAPEGEGHERCQGYWKSRARYRLPGGLRHSHAGFHLVVAARSLATKPKPQTAAKEEKRGFKPERRRSTCEKGNEFYHHHKYGYDSVASAAEASLPRCPAETPKCANAGPGGTS